MCAYIRKQKKKERDEEICHQNTANSGVPVTIPLSCSITPNCVVVGLFNDAFSIEMDDELETIWKEMLMASFWHIPRICLERLRKTMKTSARMAGVPAKIWTKYKSTVLPLDQPVQWYKLMGFTDQSITRNITLLITNPHNIQKFSSYFKENTPYLHYMDTLFKWSWFNFRSLYSEDAGTVCDVLEVHTAWIYLWNGGNTANIHTLQGSKCWININD